MILATQYYRPPFPDRDRWADDLRRIRRAGLQAIQLWVTWSWVEPEQGVFDFGDYRELISLADQEGLGVILSTVAELQPFWIHRAAPQGALWNHHRQPVPSTCRVESNQGLTPGCCFDHQNVRDLMGCYFEATIREIGRDGNLLAWDLWNENRWNVHTNGYACYCDATLARFREWLRERYGTLQTLNREWKRRYCAWEDVQPDEPAGHSYVNSVAFQRFLQWRSEDHLRFRTAIFRAAQVPQPLLAHGPVSSIDMVGYPERFEQPLSRGDDWQHAKGLDGYGVSFFPLWRREDEFDFGVRVEALRSACGDKAAWMSELQGGASNYGFTVGEPVRAETLRHWLWSAAVRGIKGTIFWNWCDEVFGRESTGFGLTGADGHAAERLRELEAIAAQWRGIDWDQYRPASPQVGLVFTPAAYHLEAAERGAATLGRSRLTAYARALEMRGTPYTVLNADDTSSWPTDIGILIVPCPLVISSQVEARLDEHLARGGIVWIEAEAGSFSAEGFYQSRAGARWLARTTGLTEAGRRPPTQAPIPVRGRDLRSTAHLAPFVNDGGRSVVALARNADGEILVAEAVSGPGLVVALGLFPEPEDVPAWLETVLGERDVRPARQVTHKAPLVWRQGWLADEEVLFLLNLDVAQTVQVSARGKETASHGIRDNIELTCQPTNPGEAGWTVLLAAHQVEILRFAALR